MSKARVIGSRHPTDGRPVLLFSSPAKWEAWLKRNCATSEGLWIKFAKKGSGVKSVNYQEALDVALCYGWIDSQLASLDERFYLQRFTPRGAKSKWSKINCGKVAKLIEAGRMTPAGMKHVEAARKDGRWDAAYGSQRTITMPADFEAALDKSPRAAAFYAKLSRANSYACLYRIYDAKRPETRARRIEQIMAMLKEGRKYH